MKNSSLLINEPPLLVLPSLAKAIGLNDAIITQQLHYWLENPKAGVERDGFKWVFNTYDEWQENFPFWSTSTIKRTFLELEEKGVVISAQMDAKSRDMRKYYRLNYEKLAEFETLHRVNVIPSIGSHRDDVKGNTETTTENNISSIVEEANKTVDAVLEFDRLALEAQGNGMWTGRELVPSHLLSYADWWNAQTGQTMKGKINNEWMKCFTNWLAEELSIAALQEAYDTTKAWKKIIAKPSEITAAAVAIQALPEANKPVQEYTRLL